MTRQRINIDISFSTLRKLILWAASRGEKRTSWAKTVLTLRCEENYPKVKTWLEEEARRLGMTADELERAILDKERFDFEGYRQELIGEDVPETEVED